MAKLTEAKVRAMRERYVAGGISQVALAAEFGIAKSLASRVVTGKAWAHVPTPRRRRKRGKGLCGCGCGQPAPIAAMTNTRLGHVKGEPTRFIRGHAGRR